MRVRINIAVEVVKEATRAVNDMKMVLLFPLIPLFMGIIYLILWIIVCLYVASVRVDEQIEFDSLYAQGAWAGRTTIETSKFDSGMKNSALFCFFHFLWTFQFFIYLNYLVIAGALARWYFTPYDNNRQKVRGGGKNELPNRPLTESLKLTCRFHLGTIALCSFIIAVINFIRAMVKYFEEVSKSQRIPSQMQKAIFCAIHGCLWLLKCCLDKLNKNALVWVALYGNNFAVAACSSFQLLWNNLARVAAINLVGVYLLNMGKLAVGMLTTAILCFIAYSSKGMEAETIALPALMWFVFSVVIAHIFFVEMDTAVDTIFLCFLIDEKNNKANNCMLASPELQALVNKHAKESAAKALEIKEVEMTEVKADN